MIGPSHSGMSLTLRPFDFSSSVKSSATFMEWVGCHDAERPAFF